MSWITEQEAELIAAQRLKSFEARYLADAMQSGAIRCKTESEQVDLRDPISLYAGRVSPTWLWRPSLERWIEAVMTPDHQGDAPASAGRPKGRSLKAVDTPLVEKMRMLRDQVASPTAAAWKVVDSASGDGTPESKVRRLVRLYQATYGE